MRPPFAVYVEPRVSAILAMFTLTQRNQFLRLIAVIRSAPQSGVPAGRDDRGRSLWQVSGADVHVIVTVLYCAYAGRVFVVAVDLAPWNPTHADIL